MLIVIHIVLMILLVTFAGYGIIGFLSSSLNTERKEVITLTMPVVGYVFIQILFYQSYFIFENSNISLFLSVTTATLINIVYIIFEKIKYKSPFLLITQFLKNVSYKILFVLIAILILSSWQYIIIGENHYFHSGNEDYFDAVYGGNAYLTNTPTKLIFYDIAGSVQFHAVIKYQYSSQAFWRSLLNLSGLDGFILQQILCLLLTSWGIYWLVRYVFKSKSKTALWISFWSVAASFYFSTFMTGHIGSIMYVSVIPIFIGIILLWLRHELNWVWLVLVATIYYFLQNTYPGPINYVLIPLVLLSLNDRIFIYFRLWDKIIRFFGISSHSKLSEKLKNLKFLQILLFFTMLIVCIVIFLIYVWNYFEPYRMRALTRTNVSWKIALFKEMFMVFWGIYPPGSTGTTSILPLFIKNDIINSISLLAALFITLLAFLTSLKCLRIKERQFLAVYGTLFVPYFIIMRYVWGSSYYMYKFLYIHMFLVIIALLLWLIEDSSHWTKWKRKIVLFSFIILGSLNLIWNIFLAIDFYNRPYHKKEIIANFFSNVSPKLLSKSYLDIPNEINKLVFVWLFAERNIGLVPIKTDAEYLVKLKNVGNALYNSVDKVNTLYDNGLLSLQENSKVNDMSIETSYSYEPNNYNGININWIGNDLSNMDFVYNNFIVDLIEHIRASNISKEAYLDISEPDLYYLISKKLENRGIKINPDPTKSLWFIRRRSGYSIYESVKGEYTKWDNAFFVIDYLPINNRVFSSPFLETVNLTSIINYIINNGNRVFLDINHNESLYHYLKQVLPKLGVNICDNPNQTNLIIRFMLYGSFSKFNSYTVYNNNEQLIETAREIQKFRKVYWDIELTNNPYEGRNFLKNKEYSTIPVRILTAITNYDFKINIRNLTNEAKFLRIILEPGPSIDFSNFVLSIYDDTGFQKKFNISSPQTMINLSLKEFYTKNGNLLLNFVGENVNGEKLLGKSLLPLEERYLNYLLLSAEIIGDDKSYTPIVKQILNRKPYLSLFEKFRDLISMNNLTSSDIISIEEFKNIKLGLGWYELEYYNSQPMRWVGVGSAEIVLDNIENKNNIAVVNLEPGPASGGKPLKLKIYIKDKFIKEEIVTGRKNIYIELPDEISKNKQDQIILTLLSETENARITSDPRILNYRVFNISLKETELQQKSIVNKKYSDKISLDGGWYPFETFNNESFHWVGKESSEIVLNNIDDKQNIVQLNLEPGPGCGNKPLKLKFYSGRQLIKEEIVTGRKNVEVQLPENIYKNNNEPIILKLITETENIKGTSDPRILNYRVFNISFKGAESIPKTIISDLNQINLGKGWYPFEVFKGESFQWVGKKPAEIIFMNSDKNLGIIKLDLEPGPSCGGDSLALDVMLNDKLLNKNKLLSRKTLEIDLRNYKNILKSGINILKLIPLSNNTVVPGDPRILNLRVFNINYVHK